MKDVMMALANGTGPAVLATVVRVEGSAYRRAGAKMLFPASGGPPVGLVSGGCLEADLAEHVPGVLASGQPLLLAYDLRAEEADLWGLNQGCNGRIEVVLEPADRDCWRELLAQWRAGRTVARKVPLSGYEDVMAPAPVLWVVGAGGDAPPLVRAAAQAGWRVFVADRRVGLAEPDRFPEADEVLALEPADLAARAGDRGYAVIMCHHFEHDRDFLQALLGRPARYLGVLGPLKRTRLLLGSEALPPCVYAPVGLSLGGETPEEIALSIVAELQAVRYGRTPGHLRGQERIRREGDKWSDECSSVPTPTMIPSR